MTNETPIPSIFNMEEDREGHVAITLTEDVDSSKLLKVRKSRQHQH